MLVPLSVPVTIGEEDTTLILYEVPAATFPGKFAEIELLEIPVRVPILTGDVKLPAELESCAVKIFPLSKVRVTVKGTITGAPAQKGLPGIAPVPIEIQFVFCVIVIPTDVEEQPAELVSLTA